MSSLSWTKSTDPWFTSYETDVGSSATGPWYYWYNFTSKAHNYQSNAGQTPGGVSYWEVFAYGSYLAHDYHRVSNVLQVTQPPVSKLNYTTQTAPGVMNVTLAWSNSATYGGNVSFGAYKVNESINGGPFSTIATLSQVGTRSAIVGGLSSGTGYAFYVSTLDRYQVGRTWNSTATQSNIVNVGSSQFVTPSASAHPSAADTGQAVTFACSASGGSSPYVFSWSFGDGGSVVGATISHTYTTSGSYVATCTARDSLASTGQGPLSMAISPSPSVSVVTNHPQVSPGSPVSLIATTVGGPGSFSSYGWNFGDGTTGIGVTVAHAYATPGVYQPTVTVVDANGVSASGGTQVTVSRLVMTAADSRSTGVPGTVFHFTSTATGGGGAPYAFVWAFGDGTTGSGSTQDHAYSAAGTYTVRVVVTDSLLGTNTTDLAALEVFAPLLVRISLTSSNPSPGSAVTLTGDITGGAGSYSCKWDFGDQNSATGCSVVHSWGTSGSYTVNLTVADTAAGNLSMTTSVKVAHSSASTPALGPTIGGISILVLIVLAAAAAIAIVVFVRVRRGKNSGPMPEAASGGAAGQFCPKCGSANGLSASFCQKCGQPLQPR